MIGGSHRESPCLAKWVAATEKKGDVLHSRTIFGRIFAARIHHLGDKAKCLAPDIRVVRKHSGDCGECRVFFVRCSRY